jgi:PBP superfamily domain
VKSSFLRGIALLTFIGAVASIIFAGSGGAVSPVAGVGCATDGGISGRGATFATQAQAAFARGFRDDVCGAISTDPKTFDGNTMVAYNYTGAVATGSGAGRVAASCRTDAFGGTDGPYTVAQLAQMNGAKGATGGCPAANGTPFQPLTAPWPAAADADNVPVMSFPVTGSSVAILARIPAASCVGAAPTALQFTTAMVSGLMGGDIANWNDARLRTGGLNANLANCNIPVVRVVRQDNSGTTQIVKNYFKNADPNRTGQATCSAGQTWTSLQTGANNQNWPGATAGAVQGDGSTAYTVLGGCTSVVTANTADGPPASGNPALINRCKATVGCVSYADLADALSSFTGAGNIRASVRNATDTAFQAPQFNSFKSNCSFTALSLPGGGTQQEAVGLGADTWAQDNPGTIYSDPTFKGAGYPICGLTFVLVYRDLNNGAVSNAVSRLTANQRRTLYAYITYSLSSTAQDRVANAKYATLPPSWLPLLVAGFQEAF